ncbi:Mfa1 family fimbria major subunit [Parabacteroides sp. OttesenSCG-928-G06]|nr:Mfa1 family fimbria major subunit [Parabacteroides sp. OttesenSCG-928-K15]MDL2281605.1 Mfa1 family fimbria major subunit [Parabacteroides sp. OttesenSCG-928-G06]
MKTSFFKKTALIALAAGFIMTSCTDDGPGPNDGKDETQYEKGYISMSIMSKFATKALGSGDVETGTAKENSVNKIAVVLYDANTNAVNYLFVLNDTTVAGKDIYSVSNDKLTYVTEAREVDKKPYKLAVFLNPSDALLGTVAVNRPLSAMQTAADATVASLTERGSSPATVDNFLMSNFAGLVTVTTDNIYNTKEGAEKAPVPVHVERAVAKVILTIDGSFAANSHPGISTSSIRWQVDVINKSTYWMRKQTKMLNGTEETAYNNGNGVSIANRDSMYAEDTNFEKISAAYWATLTSPGYTQPVPSSYFTTIAADDITREIKSDEYAYVTENTMTAEEQWEDVTTSVVIKATIIPTATALGTTLGAAPYFVYGDSVFSGAELQAIKEADEDNDAITTGVTWAQFKAAYGFATTLQNFLNDSGTTAVFGSDYASVSGTASLKHGSLKYFYDGVHYYNVPIRHFSNDLQPEQMAYGRYGVVRNNVYKLTLNHIKKYGDITIPPKVNPDDNQSWLSVEFTILPWVIRSQGVGL